MLKLINLGLTVLGTIIKIASNSETACEICDGALRLFDIAESDILSSRKLQRASEAISDQISESCGKILAYHAVEEERQEVIIDCLINSINATHLTHELIFRKKVSSEAIYQMLLTSAKKYSSEFDTREEELFDHLLHHVSEIIINAALASPDFTNKGIQHIINSFGTLQFKIDDILEKVEKIDMLVKSKEYDLQQYERNYRNSIKDRYGWIRLLGANSLDREERRYQLSIAYVTLEMSKNNMIGEIIDTDTLFNGSQTIWIEGEAGSGKTTFLQWIAVASASNDTIKIQQIKNTIPIMVELRSQNCKKPSLKQAIDNIMFDSDCSMPTNWLSKYLESGRALILIDGVDEVVPEEREHVLSWIEELRFKYPKSRIIITSRPQVEKSLEIDYDDIKILPMSRSKIEVFLDYWHCAVLVEKLGVPETDASSYKHRLSAQIDNSEAIRRLVTNPLLCAMICALNYKNGTIISTQRNELYDDCCKMLFGNRDKERDVHAYEYIKLSYDEKKIILSQIAYWMMKNGFVVADIDDVIACIERTKKSLKPESQIYDSTELFAYFLERCGILRTPEEKKIDFIHKSFQEYLAAYEIYREDDWGFISSKAHNIAWYETLILSMGFASEKKAQQVIQRILKANDEKSVIVAAACASNTSSLIPDLRNEITQQLARIIPPKTISEAQRLASAGEFAVPFLKYNDDYSVEQNYFCLAALDNITSVSSLSAVATHLHPSAGRDSILSIGRNLCYYTEREIRASGIENAIVNYICENKEPERLYIPESFLILLDGVENNNLSEALSKVTDLTIVDFRDEIESAILSLFTGIVSLTIIGEFDSLYILTKLGHRLESLVVCDTSRQFDIYGINKYSLPLLKKFHFHSAKWVFIDGSDFDKLYNIQELGLYLYNKSCEIAFTNFPKFKRLQRFEIYCDFPGDLDYEPLLQEMGIRQLSVMIPNDTFQITREFLEVELNMAVNPGSKTDVIIQKFEYPFGSML